LSLMKVGVGLAGVCEIGDMRKLNIRVVTRPVPT
jgi:hypothetical protein